MIIPPLPENIKPQDSFVLLNPATNGIFINSETDLAVFGSERNGMTFVQLYHLNRFYSCSPNDDDEDSLRFSQVADRITAYTEDGSYHIYFNRYERRDVLE